MYGSEITIKGIVVLKRGQENTKRERSNFSSIGGNVWKSQYVR